ncbi:MAG: sulfatase [Fuerstiella sp.]
MRSQILRLLAVGIALVSISIDDIVFHGVTNLQAQEKSKPNVVFILADDLGWSDTTLFGTTKFYKTPNMERLAKRGMVFRNAYSSSPLCSPTRAAILTGLSPARTGLTSPNCHLPEVILEAKTTATGPTHHKATFPKSVSRLDPKYDTLAEMFKDNGYTTAHFGKWHLGIEPYSPLENGFDIDIPHWHGPGPAGNYVAPWKYPDFDPQTPNEHIEDRMAEEAVKFMQQHRNKPFFLNYWMFSVHAPFDAKQALIDQYKKSVDPEDAQRSPTYAAMIESMDDAVGTLLDSLDHLGISDNTIIVFASDNGGNMYNEVDGTSATSNSPLRGGKATMYEGGIRGPAIVVQPGTIAANSQSEQRIQSSDFYPTLLDMLSISALPHQEFDGISIVPAFTGKSLQRDAIFTYFPHSPPIPEWLPAAVSVHADDWKLIRIFFAGENGEHRYKLFNLRADVGEQMNLAKSLPGKVRELDSMIEEFLQDTKAVLPLPNPKFDAAKYLPENEGKAKRKGGVSKAGRRQLKSKSKSNSKSRRKPVAGWRPAGTTELKHSEGKLVVTSTGNDPYLIGSLLNAAHAKDYVLQVTMESDSSGPGQIFWQGTSAKTRFSAERSVFFEVSHDEKRHQYSVSFSTKEPLTAIRLDPSRGTGTIKISSLSITSKQGGLVQAWKF